MKTLHLVWAPRLSGAEVLATDIALYQRERGDEAGLASLLPEHEDFRLLRGRLDAAGVPCLFPTRTVSNVARWWRLWRLVAQYRPDVILAHATIPSFYARALPMRVPVVYVMHSAGNDFERGLFRSVERVLKHRASAVIGVSGMNLRDYVEAVGPHAHMHQIQNGVDTARFAYVAETAHAGDAPQIIQIGRYNPIKDQLQTVRAFAQVARQHPGARLRLIGVVEYPAYLDEIVALVRTLGLENRVIVERSRGDIAQVLAESAVFAMPSLSEAHSIALLEALSSGIPVVANTIPAFDYARGFPGVQLVDTGNTTRYAQALAGALSQPRCERRLQGLTIDDTAARYVSIVRSLARA